MVIFWPVQIFLNVIWNFSTRNLPIENVSNSAEHERDRGIGGRYFDYGCGATDEEATADHDNKLWTLLLRLREFNCKLNRKKLLLCRSEVKFFGHLITKDELKADPDKVQAILNFKQPQNRQNIQRLEKWLIFWQNSNQTCQINTN